eukprot:scaffold191440_cov21-Prasinocladus_malaysianus.AAC.1
MDTCVPTSDPPSRYLVSVCTYGYQDTTYLIVLYVHTPNPGFNMVLYKAGCGGSEESWWRCSQEWPEQCHSLTAKQKQSVFAWHLTRL